jgi:hypothetical protein
VICCSFVQKRRVTCTSEVNIEARRLALHSVSLERYQQTLLFAACFITRTHRALIGALDACSRDSGLRACACTAAGDAVAAFGAAGTKVSNY